MRLRALLAAFKPLHISQPAPQTREQIVRRVTERMLCCPYITADEIEARIKKLSAAG
jgi:hypothetical protein